MKKKRSILSMLVLAGVLAAASSGCATTIPKAVVKSVADTDSSTKAITSDFDRVLDGYVPTKEETAHWHERNKATSDVSGKVNTWVQMHKEE